MENTEEATKSAFTGKKERGMERQIYLLDATEPLLQPGEKGSVESQDTPNLLYINALTERMRLRLPCRNRLKPLLPIHETEQRVEEAEQKLRRQLQGIAQRAPYLLPGDPGGFKTHSLSGSTQGRNTRPPASSPRGHHSHW